MSNCMFESQAVQRNQCSLIETSSAGFFTWPSLAFHQQNRLCGAGELVCSDSAGRSGADDDGIPEPAGSMWGRDSRGGLVFVGHHDFLHESTQR
jgi:hypothetical protein